VPAGARGGKIGPENRERQRRGKDLFEILIPPHLYKRSEAVVAGNFYPIYTEGPSLGGIIKSKFHLSYWFGGCCYTSWLHFFSTQLFAYSLLVGSRFLTYLGWDSIKHPLFNGFAAKSVRRRARGLI